MKTKLTVLFILIACFLSIGVSAQRATLTIKESDNGKTFTIKKGSAFDVLFKKECVGCRYIWTITGVDSAKIRSVSNAHSNKSCKNCAGGTQDHVFRFKALKAGSSPMSFSYGEQLFKVTVKVK